MEELKIEYVDIDELKAYEKNAKLHDKKQVDQIVKSIEQFGMNDPIGVWKDNEVVEGHGRLMACKKMGMKKVPIIRLEHMSDEERKAYILVHNQLTMNTGWDDDLLNEELGDILDIDMEEFGFEIFEDMPQESVIKENERVRTLDNYNLKEFDEYAAEGYYQMPVIYPCKVIPDDIIGFNYAKSAERRDCGIHCFIDDYQFERLWNSPYDYFDLLGEYQCVFTPDWSLYQEMPMAMKIWNVYRSRLVGQMMQREGINVIPTVSWCEKATFDWCFDGLPHDATLAISTIGVKQDKEAFKYWKDGVDAMIEKLHPKTLLVYGGEVPYDYGKIRVVYYENHVTEGMKERKKALEMLNNSTYNGGDM